MSEKFPLPQGLQNLKQIRDLETKSVYQFVERCTVHGTLDDNDRPGSITGGIGEGIAHYTKTNLIEYLSHEQMEYQLQKAEEENPAQNN